MEFRSPPRTPPAPPALAPPLAPLFRLASCVFDSKFAPQPSDSDNIRRQAMQIFPFLSDSAETTIAVNVFFNGRRLEHSDLAGLNGFGGGNVSGPFEKSGPTPGHKIDSAGRAGLNFRLAAPAQATPGAPAPCSRQCGRPDSHTTCAPVPTCPALEVSSPHLFIGAPFQNFANRGSQNFALTAALPPVSYQSFSFPLSNVIGFQFESDSASFGVPSGGAPFIDPFQVIHLRNDEFGDLPPGNFDKVSGLPPAFFQPQQPPLGTLLSGHPRPRPDLQLPARPAAFAPQPSTKSTQSDSLDVQIRAPSPQLRPDQRVEVFRRQKIRHFSRGVALEPLLRATSKHGVTEAAMSARLARVFQKSYSEITEFLKQPDVSLSSFDRSEEAKESDSGPVPAAQRPDAADQFVPNFAQLLREFWKLKPQNSVYVFRKRKSIRVAERLVQFDELELSRRALGKKPQKP